MNLSLNGGYEFSPSGKKPAVAFGLGVYNTPAHYYYAGQLIETSANKSTTIPYNFNYHVTSSRLMAEMQLTWKLLKLVSPFFNLGVGSAWNRLSTYSESVATGTGVVALPPFQSHSQTNFAYPLGVGLASEFNFSKERKD